MHYSSDESIDEDLAFNSEDEEKYGKFFEGKSSADVSGYAMAANASKLLGVQVDVPMGSKESEVVTLDVLEGTKIVLSSACIDVPCNKFQQSKLMFRCIYEDGDEEMPWMCICNFVGHSSIVPTASLNSFEIVGPCVVEWKTSSIDVVKIAMGSVNIFGQIVSTNAFGGSVFVDKDTDLGENLSLKAKSSSGKKKDLVHAQTDELAKSNKRKLSHDLQDKQTAKDADKSAAPKSSESPKESNNKLTKKQRKQLAEEKAKQLEETLTAARDTNPETKSQKKKKKKAKTDEEEPISKPTSLTRERRLPGGIVVSDILIGTGTTVSSGRKISLHYTGKLTNGKVFDKNHSRTQPLQFRQGTGEVIRGLERGLEGMRVGGERLITVPSALGYGEKGAGVEIPPDSDLVFEVKVLKVG